MSERTITSRDFAAEPLKVKQLVATDTVIVTNRGRPELAILPYERYRALTAASAPRTLLEALGDEEAGAVELEIPLLDEAPSPASF